MHFFYEAMILLHHLCMICSSLRFVKYKLADIFVTIINDDRSVVSLFCMFKVNGPFVQTFCIEKDSYMEAI